MPNLTSNNHWSHLPNAKYIDEVLASLKSHTDIWAASCGDAAVEAQSSLRNTYRAEAWSAAWQESRALAREAAWEAVWNADICWVMAWDALVSLIAYDHSSKYYLMDDPDKLLTWHALSDDPACVLMLPAVIARSKIQELVK